MLLSHSVLIYILTLQVLECIEECGADTESYCAELHSILLQPHFIVSYLAAAFTPFVLSIHSLSVFSAFWLLLVF